MKNFRPIYFIELLVLFLIFATLQYLGAHWLLYPEYNYDEGYYVMAARRMLEGDWFLQNHSFDKPFLHPLLLALSATIFGSSFLGYRLLGWLFFSASFFIFYCALGNIFKESSAKTATAPMSDQIISAVARLTIAGFLFLHPVMISNNATTMGEPFLMFFMSLVLLRITQAQSDKQQALFINAFSLAFWVKGSILIWSPLIFIFSWNKEVRQKLYTQRYILLPFLIVSLVGLWFGIVGKTKLFVFRYLLDVLFATEGSAKGPSSFIYNLTTWTQLLWVTYGIGFFLLIKLIFAVTIAKTAQAFSDRSQSIRNRLNQRVDVKQLLAICLTLLFFAAVVLFTKVGIMDRYVLTITPIVAFAIALLIKLALNTGGLLKKPAAYPTIAVALMSLIAVPFSVRQWKPGPLSSHAYTSVAIDTEVPKNASLINNIVWPHGSYVANDLQVIEQPYDIRLNRHHGQFAMTPSVFAFDQGVLFEGLQYKDPQTQTFCPEWKQITQPLLTLTHDQFKSIFLKTLLAEGKLEWTSFQLTQRALKVPTDFLKRFDYTLREAASSVTLSAKLTGKDKVKGEHPELQLEGDLVFYRGRSLINTWAANDIWVMGLRLERLYWVNQKMDLMPLLLIFKKSLTIPIVPVRIANDQQRPQKINIDKAMLSIIGMESQNRCGTVVSF